MTDNRLSAESAQGAAAAARANVPRSVEDELPEHLPALRAFARSLTRDAVAADDLVQNTLLKAWAKLHRFEPGTNMRAWLFTILRNTFYADRRRAQREVADVDDVYRDKLARKPDHDGRLNLRDFQAAFARLPAEQREALMLVGALQHSYDEAADIAEVRVGTIKSRLNRGRLRLSEMLGLAEDDAMELTDAATAAVVTRPYAAAA